MKTSLLASACLVALTAAGAPPAAARPAPGPGLLCGMVAVPFPAPPTYFGVVFGGPLSGTGTLHCTVQVNASTHAGADAATASGSDSGGQIQFSMPVTFFATPEEDNVYLCTAFTSGWGTTYYHADSGDPVQPGFWTTNPHSACALLGAPAGWYLALPSRA